MRYGGHVGLMERRERFHLPRKSQGGFLGEAALGLVPGSGGMGQGRDFLVGGTTGAKVWW